MKKILWAAVLATLCSTTPAQAIVYDFTSSTNTMVGFGEGGTFASFGQVITPVGLETRLDSFTLGVNDVGTPDVVDFRAHVATWTGTAAGTLLFSSDVTSTTAQPGIEYFQFPISGLNLVAGQSYVIFFSTFGLSDGVSGTGGVAITSPTAYSGGNFVYLAGSATQPFSTNFTGTWSSLAFDAAFAMQLSAVPEPGLGHFFSTL